MKKLVLFLITFGLCISCEDKPIRGFVVAKEYTPGHMDNEHAKHVEEATFVPHVPIVYVHHHEPEFVPSKFTLYVANRYSVYDINVDSLTYIKTKVGQRITIKR